MEWRVWITCHISLILVLILVSNSVSNIQGYFEYIMKKHETVTDNSSVRIYVNKTENKISFKIKTGYYLILVTPETIKLLESTKSKITKMNFEKMFLI